MSLMIVGGTVVDVIFSRVPALPVWPRHTEFTVSNLVLLARPPIVTLGGNGANAAYVAASVGANVTLHTPLGADALGGLARQWLAQAGCRVVAGRAPSTAINVTAANAQLERGTFFYPGQRPALPPLPSGSAKKTPRVLLVCGWPHPPLPALARYFAAVQRRGTFTALDAGPILGRSWTLRALKPVLAKLDLFLGNDYELRRVTGIDDFEAALALLRREFSGHVVVKCGAKGAYWLPAGENVARHFPRRRVRVVNTVGAGDSFNGALLAALARGEDFPAALRAATVVAASVVGSPRGLLGMRAGGLS